MNVRNQFVSIATLCGVAGLSLSPLPVTASSHREAPFITTMPKVDGTDFYMFNSYEAGREGFVTLIANYLPLQDAYGGPNYFTLDSNARYDINVDNNGDAKPDVVFSFRFRQERRDLTVPAGGKNVGVPLINLNQIGPAATDNAALNVLESYTVDVHRRMKPTDQSMHTGRLRNAVSGESVFIKPVDNIGNKSIPDYAAYAGNHIYNVNVPNCGAGRLFVGQRKEGFVVNLGETFDLVNTNPVGPRDGEANTIDDKNITSLALEVPASCLTRGDDPVIGAWTSASKPENQKLQMSTGGAKEFGNWTQVSRLGNPLVNELVIGLADKDRFNSGSPRLDSRFAKYVTNPTLPVILESLFGVRAPTAYPRSDLVAVFLTGVDGLNKPKQVRPAEMLRLNTGIAAVPVEKQDSLGVLAGDAAGFPNGRRPGDDVVDIALRAAMGVLLDATAAPDGQLPYTDGAYLDATRFDSTFPYLVTPIPGSPN